MSKLTDRFWELCAEADEAFQGIDDVQPALRSVFELVESAPDARGELTQCFVELLRGRGPWEVAYFCMRRLRWPEVYEAATEMSNATDDFRVKNVMSHIRAAYNSQQNEDDDLY